MSLCSLCGCNAPAHLIDCVNAPKISTLAAARFNKARHPSHLDPRAALAAALEWYDAQTVKPAHIVVLVGTDVGDEGCSGTNFFQAGSYRHHGQMGLCLEAMHMIRESGEQ